MSKEILQLLWILLVIGAVLALSYVFTRYVAGRTWMTRQSRRGQLEVLERLSVGREEQVMLVRLGMKLCFLGVTSQSITCLGEITPQEWDQLQEEKENAAGTSGTMGFQEALSRVLEQRGRKRGGG